MTISCILFVALSCTSYRKIIKTESDFTHPRPVKEFEKNRYKIFNPGAYFNFDCEGIRVDEYEFFCMPVICENIYRDSSDVKTICMRADEFKSMINVDLAQDGISRLIWQKFAMGWPLSVSPELFEQLEPYYVKPDSQVDSIYKESGIRGLLDCIVEEGGSKILWEPTDKVRYCIYRCWCDDVTFFTWSETWPFWINSYENKLIKTPNWSLYQR